MAYAFRDPLSRRFYEGDDWCFRLETFAPSYSMKADDSSNAVLCDSYEYALSLKKYLPYAELEIVEI